MRLCAPILAYASRPEGLNAMPVQERTGIKSRAEFSALEALGRLLCGIAPWLELAAQGSSGAEAPDLAAVHRLIEISCAPTGAAALNFSVGTQPLVDAAFLAQAMLRAPTALWEHLPPTAKEDLVRSLERTRSITPHFNNWLLFSAMIEAAFCRLGVPWDRVRVDYALRQHEQWYCGDGLYSDGPHFRLDYYNGYVIQPMLRDILDAVAGENPAWDEMAPRLDLRMARYAQLLERLIGPDGTFPPLGRSIIYRGAAFQPLAQLALRKQLPDALAAGQVRAALGAVVEATLSKASFGESGCLSIGLSGDQPMMAERYISTGSLYLCSTIFLPLGLPASDPYWTEEARPWTQKKLWSQGEDLAPDVSFDG